MKQFSLFEGAVLNNINQLTVSGDSGNLQVFLKDIHPNDYDWRIDPLRTPLTFERFMLMPEDLIRRDRERQEKSIDKGGQPLCWHYARRKWDTIWGICDARLLREAHNSLVIEYRTVDMPSRPLIGTISEQYPQLVFRNFYDGPTWGEFTYKEGQCIDDVPGNGIIYTAEDEEELQTI